MCHPAMLPATADMTCPPTYDTHAVVPWQEPGTMPNAQWPRYPQHPMPGEEESQFHLKMPK